MVKKILRFIAYSLLMCLGIFLFKVFVPKSYDVPQLQARANTKYWNLSTGSRIGYTLISARGLKKPYPVIYVHGGPGGPVYDRNIEALTPLADDGYDVYLYDQVGCGQSGKLEDISEYTAQRHCKDLEEIVNLIGAEKVSLIGQSWGAMLSTLFVVGNPGKIEKLIFTGPGPILPVNWELASIPAPDSLHLKAPLFSNADANRTAQTIRSQVMAYWARFFGSRLAAEKEADDFAVYLTNLTNKSMVCDTTKAVKAAAGIGFYAQLMTVNSFEGVEDIRPKIKNSRIPLLLIKGQCDNQPWGFMTEYLELFPNHKLVIIANAGHGIAIEQPELYLKTIRDFLLN